LPGDAWEPRTWHRYQYAYASPISYYDPYGAQTCGFNILTGERGCFGERTGMGWTPTLANPTVVPSISLASIPPYVPVPAGAYPLTCLPFGDSRADAYYLSFTFTGGGLKFFWTGSLDVVLAPAKGELGFFWSPRIFGSSAKAWLMAAPDDIFPFISPQVGGSVTWGKVWGDVFREQGVQAYKGPFSYFGGTIAPGLLGVTGEVFASHSLETGALSAQVVGAGRGIAMGLSFPPQGEIHIYITESKLVGSISVQKFVEFEQEFWREVLKEAQEFPIIPGP